MGSLVQIRWLTASIALMLAACRTASSEPEESRAAAPSDSTSSRSNDAPPGRGTKNIPPSSEPAAGKPDAGEQRSKALPHLPPSCQAVGFAGLRTVFAHPELRRTAKRLVDDFRARPGPGGKTFGEVLARLDFDPLRDLDTFALCVVDAPAKTPAAASVGAVFGGKVPPKLLDALGETSPDAPGGLHPVIVGGRQALRGSKGLVGQGKDGALVVATNEKAFLAVLDPKPQPGRYALDTDRAASFALTKTGAQRNSFSDAAPPGNPPLRESVLSLDLTPARIDWLLVAQTEGGAVAWEKHLRSEVARVAQEAGRDPKLREVAQKTKVTREATRVRVSAPLPPGVWGAIGRMFEAAAGPKKR